VRLHVGSAAGAILLLLAAALAAQQPQLPPGGYKAGFPLTLSGGNASHGEPVVADFGLTPGHKSIVFGTSGHKLYVVLWNGTVAPGFPVTLPADIFSSPAIGDIDGDGIPDIVVGYGSTIEQAATGTSAGGVRAYHRDGSLLWARVSGDFDSNGQSDPVMSTPAIGDVDGDGLVEVAWGSLDAHVYLVRGADGVDKPGWPRFVRDTVFSSPALADLAGDGKLEVIIGADAHAEGPPYNTPDGGCLHALKYDDTEFPGFPQCIDQVIISSPAVGDINGDGKPEIVVGTGLYYPSRAHKLYAFACSGAAAPGWPVSTDGQVTTAPALADLDGDGTLDVVATDDNTSPSTTFHVYAFKGNGTLLWKTVPKDFFGNTLSAGHPVVADILGDGSPEVIVSSNTELCVLSKSGVQLTDDGTHPAASFSFFGETTMSDAAVTDFESDGASIEVVAISATPFPSATNAKVYVWTPKAPSTPPWGMYRQNPGRTGVAPSTPSCAPAPLALYTVTPCRAVDTRQPAGSLGGPALGAGTTRDFPIRGTCGIPPNAKSVALNVTVTGGTAPGDLRLFPSGVAPPLTSTINWSAGQTRANNAIVSFGVGGDISIRCDMPSGATHVIIDVDGYFQ
jgi:FG-GAP-like repeat/FG-GAP repeat